MGIDMSMYKVIHSDKVYNAIAIGMIDMPDLKEGKAEIARKPKFLEVFVINEDGNVMSIYDEAWTFQFIPRTPTK